MADDELRTRLEALGHFKDWSNYLLVTTVAALGWVATTDALDQSPVARDLCVLLLTLSVLYGMLTLALVPHVTQRVTQQQGVDGKLPDVYDVVVSFTLPWKGKARLRHVLALDRGARGGANLR